MPEENKVLEATATLRFARISARKVKIVADLIRGKKSWWSLSNCKIYTKGIIWDNREIVKICNSKCRKQPWYE